jgi:thiamine biosynthesis lipoprotein
MMAVAGMHRHVSVEEIMGTTISIHVITMDREADVAAEAVARCFGELRDLDRVFSTYRHHSDISRLRRGERPLGDLDPRLSDVAEACEEWERATCGRFSAHWQGWFDPTGYVKGWAVEEAARRQLAPLVHRPGVVATGINAGGDLQLFTADSADWQWRIGIADPGRPGAVVATLAVANGAVATSGTAERGHHIVDPRSGQAARGVASATVVADGLAAADVWATAAVVAGASDLSWISNAATRSGVLIGADGAVRRWLGSTEVTAHRASDEAIAALR